jgi:hypothetical protein
VAVSPNSSGTRLVDPAVAADDACGDRLQARLEDLHADLVAMGDDLLALLDELAG